jgi:hypothetical protein
MSRLFAVLTDLARIATEGRGLMAGRRSER